MMHWNATALASVPDQKPLAGVKVLDFSELVPGPFMTQSLVEMGADVIKIERPPHGDNLRVMSPSLFDALNRGKRSMQLNLKDEHDREQVLRLLDGADVLVENYRPGVMQKLGLGAADMLARHPRLIYVSVSGYGSDGPWRQRSGHDMNYLASAGIVALSMTEANPAPFMGVPYADVGASVYALAALTTALFQRERTNRGQHLDVSMADCAAHWCNVRIPVLRNSDPDNARASISKIQKRPGYGVFRCSDDQAITIAALEMHFWQALVRTLDLDDFADGVFESYPYRAQHTDAINRAIGRAIARWSSAEAIARLEAADVPVSLVESPLMLHENAQFKARGLFVDTPRGPLARFPVRLAGM
ncbi:CaiB/BaiF CoA transferase family protein [Bordetella muralis]|jgi:CoA:oxalate CoA-transferase|uniref:CaiB/BaiF CoA transferase family protein n=1 Tax=Bordetella muralis TaxID=1649130 RepID=UPI0039EEBF39